MPGKNGASTGDPSGASSSSSSSNGGSQLKSSSEVKEESSSAVASGVASEDLLAEEDNPNKARVDMKDFDLLKVLGTGGEYTEPTNKQNHQLTGKHDSELSPQLQFDFTSFPPVCFSPSGII